MTVKAIQSRWHSISVRRPQDFLGEYSSPCMSPSTPIDARYPSLLALIAAFSNNTQGITTPVFPSGPGLPNPGSSSFEALPTEVLCDIFLEAVTASHTDSQTAAVSISQVCRHFRAIAVDIPSLWTELTFQRIPSFELVHSILFRSRARCVQVVIDISSPITGTLKFWTFLLTLARHLPRFRMLSISLPFGHFHFVQKVFSVPCRAPSLQVLKLVKYGPGPLAHFPVLLVNPQRFSSLHMEGVAWLAGPYTAAMYTLPGVPLRRLIPNRGNGVTAPQTNDLYPANHIHLMTLSSFSVDEASSDDSLSLSSLLLTFRTSKFAFATLSVDTSLRHLELLNFDDAHLKVIFDEIVTSSQHRPAFFSLKTFAVSCAKAPFSESWSSAPFDLRMAGAMPNLAVLSTQHVNVGNLIVVLQSDQAFWSSLRMVVMDGQETRR